MLSNSGISSSFLNVVSNYPLGPSFESSNWVGSHEGGHCQPSLLFACNLSFLLSPFQPPYRRFLNTRRLFIQRRPEMFESHLRSIEWTEPSQAAALPLSASSNEPVNSYQEDYSLNTDGDAVGVADCRLTVPQTRNQGANAHGSTNFQPRVPEGHAGKGFASSQEMGFFTDGLQTFNEKFILSMGIEHRLRGHQGCINTIHVDSLGQFHLSGSDDRHLCIHNTFTWELLHRYATAHTQNIFDALFLPYDHTKILSCGLDGDTLLTDTVTGVSFDKYSSSSMANCIVCPRSWPNTAYVGYGDGRLIGIDTRCCAEWSAQSTVFCPASPYPVNTLAMHERNPYTIACGTDIGLVFLVDIRMTSLAPYAAICVAKPPLSEKTTPYSQNGNLLIQQCAVSSLSFNQRGDWLAVNFRDEDAFLVPWLDCLQKTHTRLLEGAKESFDPTGLENSSAELSGVRMYFPGSQPIPIAMSSVSDGMRCLYGRVNDATMFKQITFMEDDTMVCTGSDDGTVVFWRTNDGKYLGKVKGDGTSVNCVLYPPTLKRLLVSGFDSTVKVFAPMIPEEAGKISNNGSKSSLWSRDHSRVVMGMPEPLWPAASTAPSRGARVGHREEGDDGEFIPDVPVRYLSQTDNSSHSVTHSDSSVANPNAEITRDSSTSSEFSNDFFQRRWLHVFEDRLQMNFSISGDHGSIRGMFALLRENNGNEERDESPPYTGFNEEEHIHHSDSEVSFLEPNEQTAPGVDTTHHSDSSESDVDTSRHRLIREIDHSEIAGQRTSLHSTDRHHSLIDALNRLIIAECRALCTISCETNRATLSHFRDCLESIMPEILLPSQNSEAPQVAQLLDEIIPAGYSRNALYGFSPETERGNEEQLSVERFEMDSLLSSFSSGSSEVSRDFPMMPPSTAEQRSLSPASARAEPPPIRRKGKAKGSGGDHEGSEERRDDEVASSHTVRSPQREASDASNSFHDPRRRNFQNLNSQYPVRNLLRLIRHLFSILQRLFEKRCFIGFHVLSSQEFPPLVDLFEGESALPNWETCSFANPMFPWLSPKARGGEVVRRIRLPQDLDDMDGEGDFFHQDPTSPSDEGFAARESAYLGIVGVAEPDLLYGILCNAESDGWMKERWQRFSNITHRLVLLLRIVQLLLMNHYLACRTRGQSRRFCALLARLHIYWVFFYMSVGVWDLALHHCEILDRSFEFASLVALGGEKAPPREAARQGRRPQRMRPPSAEAARARRPARARGKGSPSPSSFPSPAEDPEVWAWVPDIHAHLARSPAGTAGDARVGGNALMMPMRRYRKLLIPLILKVKTLSGALQALMDQMVLLRRPHREISTTNINRGLLDLDFDAIGPHLTFLSSAVLMDSRTRLKRYLQDVKSNLMSCGFGQTRSSTVNIENDRQYEEVRGQVRLLRAQLCEAYHELRRRMRRHPNTPLVNRILSVLKKSNISTAAHFE